MRLRGTRNRRMMNLGSLRAVTHLATADYAASGIGAARKGAITASS